MKRKDKIFILLLFFLLGCAIKELRIKSTKEIPMDLAEQTINKYRESRKNLRSVRLKANAKIDSRKQRFFFKEWLMADRPYSLYLASLKFGTPAIYITMKDYEVTAYEPSSGSFFKGRNISKVISRIVGVRGLSRDEIMAIAFGEVFIPDEIKINRAWQINEKYIKISLVGIDGSYPKEVIIDPKRNIIIQADWMTSVNNVRAVFASHRFKEEYSFPHIIKLENANPYFEVVLKIKELELNGKGLDENFQIAIPPGTEVKTLENMGSFLISPLP